MALPPQVKVVSILSFCLHRDASTPSIVSERMFASISGNAVGLRLPATAATELQFSRDDVVPFQPRGLGATREWVQIDRADHAGAFSLLACQVCKAVPCIHHCCVSLSRFSYR
jgi:hypothetical protein